MGPVALCVRDRVTQALLGEEGTFRDRGHVDGPRAERPKGGDDLVVEVRGDAPDPLEICPAYGEVPRRNRATGHNRNPIHLGQVPRLVLVVRGFRRGTKSRGSRRQTELG